VGLPSPRAKIAIVTVVLIVFTVGLLVYSMLQQAKVSCEVCVAFHGNNKCRSAVGPTRDEAIKTATTNACGYLTSGMANSIACQNTPPLSVACEGD